MLREFTKFKRFNLINVFQYLILNPFYMTYSSPNIADLCLRKANESKRLETLIKNFRYHRRTIKRDFKKHILCKDEERRIRN